jgi:ribosomal protein L7Ae-like RNA K-turn-binding protein
MKIDQDRLLGLVGIARRSGRLTTGFDAVKALVAAKKNVLVLFAADLSPKTEKKLRYAVGEENKIIHLPYSKDELGSAIGSVKPVGVLALEDRGFAEAVRKLCEYHEGDSKEEGSIC